MARRAKKQNEIVFYSYPKLLFCWPLMVLGILFYFIAPDLHSDTPSAAPSAAAQTAQAAEPSADEADAQPPAEEQAAAESSDRPDPPGHSTWLEFLGWVYLIALALVLVTLGIDLERNTMIFWLVAFFAVFIAALYLQDVRGFTLIGDLGRWFADRNIQYDRGFGLALAALLAVPFGAMLIWVRVQHKWRITHNEFEHYSWGRADDSLARGAKRVRSTYPDLLELLLCLAGTLIVYSATGRSELRRIHHVPLLPLRRRQINRILEMTAVTSADEAIMEEEVAAEDDEETPERPEGRGGGGIGDERL